MLLKLWHGPRTAVHMAFDQRKTLLTWPQSIRIPVQKTKESSVEAHEDHVLETSHSQIQTNVDNRFQIYMTYKISPEAPPSNLHLGVDLTGGPKASFISHIMDQKTLQCINSLAL